MRIEKRPIAVFWPFLISCLTTRHQYLDDVAQKAGFSELVPLVRAGINPHIGTKELEALGKEIGLPGKLLSFLEHSGEDQNITLEEAESLAVFAKQAMRRDHANLNTLDYRSALELLRSNGKPRSQIEMKECNFCGTEFPGSGRCPDCFRTR